MSFSRAVRSVAGVLAGAVVATLAIAAGTAAAAPVTPTSGGSPTATAPSTKSIPTCLPGQESAPLSGSGTPAPLGNLEGLPAAVKSGGTFADIPLTAGQVEMAATIVAVGKQMGITRRGIEIALAVATEQSSLRPEALNKDWLGLFQQNPIDYTQYRRTEPGGASWMFYDRLLKLVPKYDTDPRPNYQIGDVVQQTTTGERFAQYDGMAADFTGRVIDAVSLHQDDVTCTPAAGEQATGSAFDPGNIISDTVFYNTAAMTVDQIRVFLRSEGEACTGPSCLKNLAVTTVDQPADRYCAAYQGGRNEDAAAVIAKVSTACGINPQVMLVTLQKESALLSRTDPTPSTYNAAWGWHCPDTGPGGSANCDPAHAGFFNQGYGMAKQWARYRLDPDKYNYHAGQTADIMWNVAESGCGSAPVAIKNTATASLYNYTPYQPDPAALAAYPGVGDKCSAYGNRNFFYLFRKYFGPTGGGSSTDSAAVRAAGTTVTIPKNQYVSAALGGQKITAPNAAVAAGLAAGFSALGMPYVWGGGGSGDGPNNGCARGGGDYNSCGTEIGFDCSGLTAYVLGMAGYRTPGDSGSQRAAGMSISWSQALPGDIIGFPGHVAVYLGTFGGRPYILEASWVGTPIHIVPMTRTDFDDRVHRYWTGTAVGAPRVADFGSIIQGYAGPTYSYSAGPAAGSTAPRTYLPNIPRIRPRAYPTPVTPPPIVTPKPPATKATPPKTTPAKTTPPTTTSHTAPPTTTPPKTTPPRTTPPRTTPPKTTPPRTTPPRTTPPKTTPPTSPSMTATSPTTTASATPTPATTASTTGATTTGATTTSTTVASTTVTSTTVTSTTATATASGSTAATTASAALSVAVSTTPTAGTGDSSAAGSPSTSPAGSPTQAPAVPTRTGPSCILPKKVAVNGVVLTDEAGIALSYPDGIDAAPAVAKGLALPPCGS